MTVGDLGIALRRLGRIDHPRTHRRGWITLGVIAAIAAIAEVFAGGAPQTFALGVGLPIGAAAVFLLLGRLWGWIVLAVALGLGLGAIPLFGVLGLELSIAVALFAALMGADLGAAVARERARIPPSGVARAAYPGRTLAIGAAASAALVVAIAAIPGVIAAVRGIFVPTCDWAFGVESYVAMPLATAALAGAIGHAMGALTGPRRFVGAAVAQLPAIVVALAALWRFYAAPPVYTYNAVLGYFPGNLYDEHVQLSAPLAWSRLEQLAWVVAVIAAVALRFDVASYRVKLRAPRPAGRRLAALATALAAAVLAFALRLEGGALGFAVDADDLEAALGGTIETEHFIIHYARTAEIEADLPMIAEDHEFRYRQVVDQLGVAPAGKLVSFYFADRDEKYRLHGSRNVEMAKPWRGELYLDHRAFPHPSLRHEIAHAVAAEFGDPIWGVSSRRVLGVPVLISPGLVEGLAVAVDWPGSYDRPNPHELVRVIQALGSQPSISSLLGLSFFSVSSAHGYTTAGSFLRFLLERYGAARVRELYRSGGDFEAAYGVPRAELEREWRAMLATIPVPEATVQAQKERFRRGSVFARPCPHAIADTRARATAALVDGDRELAIALMREVCDESAGEPRYRLELARLLYGGDDGQRAAAFALWDAVALDARVTSLIRAQAFGLVVRAAVVDGRLDHARRVLAYARTLSVDPDHRRQLDAMAFALAHDGPAGSALRDYFFPARDDPDDDAEPGPPGVLATPLVAATAAATAEPELGFAHYLLGLQLAVRREPGAAGELALALQRGLPGPEFVRNAARRLAVAAYRDHDRARLDAAIAVLSRPEMTSGDHLLAKDWQDRLAFDAAHPDAATPR